VKVHEPRQDNKGFKLRIGQKLPSHDVDTSVSITDFGVPIAHASVAALVPPPPPPLLSREETRPTMPEVDDFLSNDATANRTSSLLTCAFNQDGGCLAVGTAAGFSVHNLYPQYAVSVDRELTGGVGIVEMLFRCNLLVLVGGGPAPVAPPHRVLIHDDHVNRPIGELSFRQVVLAAKLRKDAIAVALRDRVYVYHLADLSLRDKIYTADNPHGLLCLSTEVQDMVLACPSVTTGHVRVELYGSRKTVVRAFVCMCAGLVW
jgi:WD repeat-containing protein 45